MKIALYARVSTNGHGQDPEVQLRELRQWAATHKHTVGKVYVDSGFSGSKASRPQLDLMMRDAKQGLFEAIAVWKLDRLFRSVLHMVATIEELKSFGVQLISLKEALDFTTSSGRLMFHVISAMAEFERDIIGERIRAGLKNAKAKGRLPGRKVGDKPSRTTEWRRRKMKDIGDQAR